MSKVKVSKEVARVLKNYRKSGWTFKGLMQRKMDKGGFDSVLSGSCFNDFSHEDFASILINGYEVEETLEEKWAKNIEDYKMLAASDDLREKCYGSEQLILLKKLKADKLIDLPGLD